MSSNPGGSDGGVESGDVVKKGGRADAATTDASSPPQPSEGIVDDITRNNNTNGNDKDGKPAAVPRRGSSGQAAREGVTTTSGPPQQEDEETGRRPPSSTTAGSSTSNSIRAKKESEKLAAAAKDGVRVSSHGISGGVSLAPADSSPSGTSRKGKELQKKKGEERIPSAVGQFSAYHGSEGAGSRSRRDGKVNEEETKEEEGAGGDVTESHGAFRMGRHRDDLEDDYNHDLVSGHVNSNLARANSNALGIPLAAEVVPEVANQQQVNMDDAIQEYLSKAPTASAMPLEETKEESKCSRKTILISIIGLLLVVGGVVGAVVATSGGDSGDRTAKVQSTEPQNTEPTAQGQDSTPSPTLSPTTMAPTSYVEYLYALIATYSGTSLLEDEISAQHFGFEWLASDTSPGEWEDDVILERYALATLFYATDGNKWATVTDFLLPFSHCAWDGVVCDLDDRPVALNLVAENLGGTLPAEIGLLTSLTSMNLIGNTMVGSLPSEIGFLTDLKSLHLGGQAPEGGVDGRFLEDGLPSSFQNNFLGTIPTSIGLMTSLQSLDLQEMSLRGPIPSEMQFLTKLETCKLHRNLLDGPVPLQLGSLTSLQTLSLENNFLSGDVPNVLCSSISAIENLSADCLAQVNGDPAELGCRCCNVCCDSDGSCVNFDVTPFPSGSPTTSFPSTSPSDPPSSSPSSTPSMGPSFVPSTMPSSSPSFVPSSKPSASPSTLQSLPPTRTAAPTTSAPTTSPTKAPSTAPVSPTKSPSTAPSMSPKPSANCLHLSACQNGQRVCQGAVGLCADEGSCNGRSACQNTVNLDVGEFSCIGRSSCAGVEPGSGSLQLVIGDNR